MRLPSKFAAIALLAACVSLAGARFLSAQTPPAPTATQTGQAPPPSADTAGGRLPVRRVVLYKSGVGYFEHVGRIRDDQTIAIDLTSGQLDDVLKSLTTVDLGEGRVTGITFNSIAPLEQRLRAIGLPLGKSSSRAELLGAVRGSRVEVQAGATRVTGRVLDVETVSRRSGDATEQITHLGLVTDAGVIHRFELREGLGVRLLDAGLRGNLGQYLDAVATASAQDVRRMAVHTEGRGLRDLFVSYVSEVPVWKSTYRLVIPAGDRKPFLQGWAIVDNTLGEDWDDVTLSLVAGAPQSFVQPLSQPIFTRRPVVPLATGALLAPQTHDGTLTDGEATLSGAVRDSGGAALPGVQVRVEHGGARMATAVTDASGRFSLTGIRAGRVVLHAQLQGFRSVREAMELRPGDERTLSLTMDVGAVTESVSVTSMPADKRTMRSIRREMAREGMAPAAAPVPTEDAITEALAQHQPAVTGADLGDLFEYALARPVTIRRNQSALVPILQASVTTERVSIWNAASGALRPLRAVWLTNDTGSTLDGGSIALMEGNTFAGEGLLDPIKPGERRLISFAADLAGRVSANTKGGAHRVSRVRIANGMMIQSTEDRSTTTYTARNEDTSPRTFVVEHPLRSGWTLAPGAKPAVESTAMVHRFRLLVPPSSSGTLDVEEVHPIETRVAVDSITTDQVALVLRGRNVDVSAEPQLRAVIAQTQEVARIEAIVDAREGEIERIEKDQERVRENLEALKTSAEERVLTARYAKQLATQEDRLEVLRHEVEQQEAALEFAEQALQKLAKAVTLDVEMP